jgi:hypothetical protein
MSTSLPVTQVTRTLFPIGVASKEISSTAALAIAGVRANKRIRNPARRTSDQAVASSRCMVVFTLSRREEDEIRMVRPCRDRATARPRRAWGGQGASGAR